jgi:hypothetical protein
MYMYSYEHIDYGWELLPTVKDYTKDHLYYMIYGGERRKFSLDNYKNMRDEFSQAMIIAKSMRACIIYAQHHMAADENFSVEPRIFFIPAVPFGDQFGFGFVWKQLDNGTSFIASPIELPHLEIEGAYAPHIIDTDDEKIAIDKCTRNLCGKCNKK